MKKTGGQICMQTIVWIDVCSRCSRRILPTFWRETPVSDQRDQRGSKSSFFLRYFHRWSEIRWAHSATRDRRHLENFFVKELEYLYISHKMRDVKGYLSRKQSEGGPLASDWVSLGELYEKRWGLFDFLTVWNSADTVLRDCLVMSAC